MGLNIKDEEAHHLARELAQPPGESMTVAVSEAIPERLERISRELQKRPGRAHYGNWKRLRRRPS